MIPFYGCDKIEEKGGRSNGCKKKGRRKIRCSDKLYIWYVQLDFDSPNYLLNVIAEDKTLILSCPLHTEKPYIISKGRAFQNRMTDGIWTPLFVFPLMYLKRLRQDLYRR